MSVSLLYQTKLPILANTSFETIGENWADHGSHALTRTAIPAQVKIGFGAGKIIAGGVGDYSTNNVSLDATYMPACIAAQTWRVRLDALADSGTPSLIIANAGNHTGAETVLNNATWTECVLDYVAQAADVATHIIKLFLYNAATVYIDNIRVMRIETFSREMGVKGVADNDGIEIAPDVLQKVLNGNYKRVEPKVFNRNMHVNLGVVPLKTQRVFLAEYSFNTRYNSIIYGSEEIEVVIPNPKQFGGIWVDDFEGTRAYEFDLIEKIGRNINPSSWS